MCSTHANLLFHQVSIIVRFMSMLVEGKNWDFHVYLAVKVLKKKILNNIFTCLKNLNISVYLNKISFILKSHNWSKIKLYSLLLLSSSVNSNFAINFLIKFVLLTRKCLKFVQLSYQTYENVNVL